MTALNPANQLTLLRMLLIPVFAILVVYEYPGAALLVFVLAGLTDLFDGFLARRAGQQSTLGAWLDPMADKLLLTTLFIVLTLPLPHYANRLPLWLTLLIISRDIGIVATVAIVNMAVGRRTFTPSFLGKLTTAVYIVTGVVVLYFNYLGYASRVVDVFIWATLALTLASGFHYVVRVARTF